MKRLSSTLPATCAQRHVLELEHHPLAPAALLTHPEFRRMLQRFFGERRASTCFFAAPTSAETAPLLNPNRSSATFIPPEAMRAFRFFGTNYKRALLPFPFSLRVISLDSVTKTKAAIETWAPAIIKSHESRIGVAGSVVTARIKHRARIASSHMPWPPTFQS